MIRITPILLFFLLSTSMIFGQSKDLKLRDVEKYSNAVYKINKALLKNPYDVGLNYAMAILLIKRNYVEYNPKKAYEYLLKSKSLYEKTSDDKELKSLNKIPINQSLFQSYTDTICGYALEDVIAVNNVETYEKYLSLYKTAYPVYKNKAIENRDIAAFKTACETNSVESYQFFISHYPDAKQKNDGVLKRNALAFEQAKAIDNIDRYKEFINKCPNAEEINQSWARIYELAFAQAEKENTSVSYKKFIDEYPNSKQFDKTFKLFEKRQFFENKTDGDWNSLKSFIETYPNNSWKLVAKDSIRAIGIRTEKLDVLKYYTDSLSGTNRNEALILYHNIFTKDGEKQTLDLFYKMYKDEFLNEIKAKDYALAEFGDNLSLNMRYKANEYSKYDEYIRLAAPSERAFVALQRMISPDIAIKDWKSAITKINTYFSCFGKNDIRLKGLISLFETKSDNSILINSIGSSINTIKGGEYVPVITADDKYLYFCGRNRNDNIGGEDIFVSKKMNGNWSGAKVVSDLSFANSNDAPLSVTADGTKMLLFKSGNLYYSEKTKIGWSEAIEFPSIINSGDWQADAMISSDGKALFFASTRKGGLNINAEDSLYPIYHGDFQLSSDIYVSVLDDNNKWGKPINLGNVINTPYCERTPFLHPDMKTLYFSSDGHGGLGKLDVFKSTRLSDSCWTCWSEPINMGKEINTEETDWCYKITTDGMRAYFSKKNSAKELEDIYWLNLPKFLRPDLVATVSGKLIDKDNQPVSAEIRWEDLETGKNIGKSDSDPADGSFFIVLPLGKMYGYYVNKADYFPISNNIDLRINNTPIQIVENINLVTLKQMVENEISVPVNNLFFAFAKSELLPASIPELKRVAVIIKSNKLKVELHGHTDYIGSDEMNQILSEQRTLAVKTFLVSLGCSSDDLTSIGYGETRPVATNETDAGRAKNRRVEIKFIK